MADRPIIDQSGIAGLYKIDTTPWLPIELGLNPPPAGAKQDGVDMADLPTLFEVFEKLGLKLEERTETWTRTLSTTLRGLEKTSPP